MPAEPLRRAAEFASTLPRPEPTPSHPTRPPLRPLPKAPPEADPGRRNRRFFDGYWRRGQQERDRIWRAWWQDGYRQVLDWAGPLHGKRVLHAFAGLGEDAHMLANAGADVVAFDFAQAGLQQARRTQDARSSPRPTWLCADASCLPLAPESFDLVIAVNGLCHTDKVRVLAEFRRVLRPGGRILFLEVMRYPHVAMAARLLEPYRKHAPHRHISVSELKSLAQPFGGLRQRQFFVASVFTAMLMRLPLGPELAGWLHRGAIGFDRLLLRICPPLRHVAYLCAAELRA